MILTETSVVEYLGQRQLLAQGSPWSVAGSPSRNRNFSAAPAQGGPGFFVKQLRVTAPASVAMMQREATVYWLSRHDEDFAALQGLIPPFVLFDGAEKVLVLGLVPGSRSLFHHQQALGDFPVAVGEGLGRALAAVHQRVGLRMRSDPSRAAFPREVPGIFTAHRGGPLVQWLGAGQMRLIDQVRKSPVLSQALDHLAATWSFDSFTHGDIKFENCVLAQVLDGEVRIVDWELADFGDPCWDAGCIVQAYLYVCLLPFLARRGEGLAGRLDHAGARAAAMREALGGFWRHYAAGRASADLERVLGCAAARLIQMALEVMHGQPEPTPQALSLLELSEEVMARPLEAAGALGLGPVLKSPEGRTCPIYGESHERDRDRDRQARHTLGGRRELPDLRPGATLPPVGKGIQRDVPPGPRKTLGCRHELEDGPPGLTGPGSR
ncbi:MAG TPA: phosphotransferase [Thermoanaerobaculia bacterium]|nr:phosphotransferase [Thermoanaerobaculia bacterium]